MAIPGSDPEWPGVASVAVGENQGQHDESLAVRSFRAGVLSAPDAADRAGLGLSAFLDLVDRTHAAEAARDEFLETDRGVDVPELSVVVPMFNEEDNVGPLLAELIPVLETLGTYEIIFIDDCSTDGSVAAVLEARSTNPAIKLIELARNFGHQGALTAGFDHARGRAVILMDADLQDPPSVLPELVARWREGYEVVYAVREARKEGVMLRACFHVFYRLLNRISNVRLPVDSGDFSLMDRRVVDAVRALPESGRFLRGLRGWVGFRQIGVHYNRGVRHSGETKYSIKSRVRFAVDGLLSFSDVPLRLASFMGILTTAAAVIYLAVAVLAKVVGGSVVKGWTSIIFVQLAIGGITLTMLGVIGEYLARVHQEAKRRPPYVLRRIHDGREGSVRPDG